MDLSTQAGLPSPGDVLITAETYGYLLSVVPYPHGLTFRGLAEALDQAVRWAHANHSEVWRNIDGEFIRVFSDNRATA